MPDQPVATPTGRAPASGRRRGWLAVARRVLGGREVRWLFVAAAVGLGVWAVVRQWHAVTTSLARMGAPAVIGAMLAILAAMVAAMLVWRVLLGALGSPLPLRAAARILFVGQLGKYLPGSVWPVLAQMELGTAYAVPRRRSATASILTMLVSLLGSLLTALVTLPFLGGAAGGYRWAFLAVPALLACLHPRRCSIRWWTSCSRWSGGHRWSSR